MKVVFVMRTPFFLKNFTSGLQQLSARGHEIEVVFSEAQAGRVGEHLADDGARLLPGVAMRYMPPPRGTRSATAILVATLLDVMRYDHAVYDDAPKLRERANGKSARRLLVAPLLAIVRRVAGMLGTERVEHVLRRLLDHVPPPRQLVDWLVAQKTDLLLVSPLTPIGSEQAVWILAARKAGIRVVYCMYSWDNLTNKGLLRPHPDGAVVWNETHRDEAVNMHGMLREAVHCVGAQGFDIWFDTRSGSERAAFCARVGLDPARPFLLYTCSSVFVGGKQEFPFIEKWLTALRSHQDPAVAGMGVLIRPHPQFSKAWEEADLSRFGNVTVYPRAGAIPFTGDARMDYYDSIHHSIGIVGINTSAMVEAAIIDRPVLTIADSSYAATQGGTLHFRHLEEYGFLLQSQSIEENLDKIARLLRGDAVLTFQSRNGNCRFVEEYIRPHGMANPAALFWADAIEAESRKATGPLARGHAGYALLAWQGMLVCRVARSIEHRLGLDAAGAGDKRVRKAKKKAGSTLKGRVKLKVLDTIKGAPPRVKDVARLEGPYRILVALDSAYATAGSVPQILALGDSVHYRIASEDKDRRTLAEMISDELRGSGYTSLCLNYSAYHSGVYEAALRALGRMHGRPDAVVLPINLRSFSPQWFLQPDHAFLEEINILDEYLPGCKIPEVVRVKHGARVEDYDATVVTYPDSPLFTIGQFRLVTRADSRSDYQEQWRARQIAIFHYMHPLVPDHPRVMDAVAMVRAAAAAGIKPLVYLTPINHDQGCRAVGERFAEAVQANVEVLRAALAPLIAETGGVFVDWSCGFADSLFFHPGERTEHLNQEGRQRLSSLIADAVDMLA